MIHLKGRCHSPTAGPVPVLSELLPVHQLCDAAEVVQQVESVNMADRRQTQVHLQRLLPALTFDLQGHRDAVTFTALQLGQVRQQPGALLGAVAPQQANPGPDQAH